MSGYVSIRLLLFFMLILTALILISYFISGDVDTNKFISFLKIFLFELPVASTSAIVIVYTFFLTEKTLTSLPSRNPTLAFIPSVFFTLTVVFLIILLQEIVLPSLAKQKLTTEGVKNVVFAIDKNRYLVVDNVKFDNNKNVYILSGVDTVSKVNFSVIKSYNKIIYDPSKNTLAMEGKKLDLNGNLEKVLIFFVDRNYFFSIWEFNKVKDSFFVFDLKTSFLNFIMYEKIFIPVISFVTMMFAITLGWKWRMNKSTKLMPIYIIVGSVVIPIAVKMVYYLSIRTFEFLVFPF
ncbi:MAG: hypothetical protein ABDH28_06795 [Brevinematia bacterium]